MTNVIHQHVGLRAALAFACICLACAGPLRAQLAEQPATSATVVPVAWRPAEELPPVASEPAPAVHRLPATGEQIEPVPTPPPEGGACEPTHVIDLLAALRLADRANPQIGITRQAIFESLAQQQGARAILLPSLTGGTNYHQHNGNVQQNNGSMLSLSQQSFYLGGGAGGALGSQTIANPAIRVFAHLGDALFEPLAARQRVAARTFEAGATFNSILLDVGVAYLDLMAAEAQLEVLLRSLQDAEAFVSVTTQFAATGQGRTSDANRARAEMRLIASQIQRARAEVAVRAANLARLLSLDPAVGLRTIGGPIPALLLVDPAYSKEQLIAIALARRPEIAARGALIAEAETRVRQERLRPLFPTLSVGFSSGTFGGGSNFSTPQFGAFNARTDFDVFAFWTAQNFGMGNIARARGRAAETGQAAWARTNAINQVRREVIEAFAQSAAAKQQIEISERRLVEAENGFREELGRIRGGEGLPIELLDNLTRAIAARQTMVSSVTTYDQAQLRLFVALGQPPTFAGPNLRPLVRR